MFKRLVAVFCLGLILTGIADAELVGWWKFDEGSGTTAYDSSGNGHDGTVLGTPEWGPGPEGFGGALNFSATMGANCGDFDPTGGTGVFTLALWCLWDGTSGTQHFLTKSNAWGAATMMFQVEVKAGDSDPARTDRMALTYQAATQAILHEVPKNEWAHMALTFDGTNATGYLNGVDEAGPQPTGIGAYVNAPVLIGITWNGTRIFQGWLDDVRLYDRALTESEIKAVMEGIGGRYPFAYGPKPSDGTLLTDTWANLSWSPGDFAVSHDIYLGDNLDDVNNGTSDTFIGNQTSTMLVVGFPGFPYPDGLIPGTTYYWRVDEVNEAEPNSPWKGPLWSFSIAPRTAYDPSPPDGAEFVDIDTTLSWTGGFGAKLHTMYLGDNFDDVNGAVGGTPQGATTFDPGPLELEKVYYWRVDEFDAMQTYRGDIWGFTTPGAPGSLQPAKGATGVPMNSTLNWTPAATAVSHDVYLGTDKDAVRNATTASPEFKGNKAAGLGSLDPGKLAWNSEYYWRIDAVYNTGTMKGLVWNFTTADFIPVDDFESYNDVDPPDPNSNRIFESWIDGFGTTDNGALVGNDLPPYAEQTIIHGGLQSMPYFYDNNLKTSEVTQTLVYPRDWTEEGVTKLSLWFRGNSSNGADRMYVALNGTAVVYNDDPAATQDGGWNQWVIDLTAFSDVNLTNVDTITIGIGTKGSPVAGGTGTMYFDDIRLIR